ncbi:purine nucleoside permease [Lineolata rhizophorae]|uniref:Purine nucleoside permease n=1 Tax=Lineolata rhizophorae TaxID=578093 RepID=A0A6A6NPX7_9PEZI|nr:purine nucleoside permease [Lineolata rhizophorae]
MGDRLGEREDHGALAPRICIISMFEQEASIWLDESSFLDFCKEIKVDGLLPNFCTLHCTADANVCQVTVGESGIHEVNAALSIYALLASPLFDFRHTYFLIAGVAGINPKAGTIGSVGFARYAVQVDLRYEFDARQIPADWATGYVPSGSSRPDEYPQIIYGTEVYELNDALRQFAVERAGRASLADSQPAAEYRAWYAKNGGGRYRAAGQPPRVLSTCDVATSNVFFHGSLLSESVEKTVGLFTGGAAKYCMTNQEDNAILAALLRGSLSGKADFSRVIVMRAGSNFDQPYTPDTPLKMPLHSGHGGFEPSLKNLYLVGSEVIAAILEQWSATFENGIPPENYIGDILGSLGRIPDFGQNQRRSVEQSGAAKP